MNIVTLVGRITKEVDLRYIAASGTPVATFTIAIDRDYTKKDGTKETDFIPVEVMGKGAEFCANYLGKGRLISLCGSVRVEQYQDQQGNKKTFTKVSTRGVQALDKGNKAEGNGQGQGLEPNGFEAIDEDIPF